MAGRFLVSYDYGQGGLWAYVATESRADIENTFEELTIWDEPPHWWNADDEATTATYDMSALPTWLKLFRKSPFTNFVRGVAEALNQIVPQGVTLSGRSDSLLVASQTGMDVLLFGENIRINLDAGTSTEDVICGAALNMLSELQDIVSVALTTPWPHEEGTNTSDMSPPHASVVDGKLRLWFGNGDTPICGPVFIALP